LKYDSDPWTEGKIKAIAIYMLSFYKRIFFAFRVIELETLDLGLSPEEGLANEKSFRDPNLTHYHPIIPKENTKNSSNNNDNNNVDEEHEEENQRKKQKTDSSQVQQEGEGKADHAIIGEEGNNNIDSVDADYISKRAKNRPKSSVNGTYEMPAARSIFMMKGHTAFLTFAIKSFS
jgi:hypothetical protein